jgi:hypothetical protein
MGEKELAAKVEERIIAGGTMIIGGMTELIDGMK